MTLHATYASEFRVLDNVLLNGFSRVSQANCYSHVRHVEIVLCMLGVLHDTLTLLYQ